MILLNATITGQPRPKKNSMNFKRLRNGRTVLLQSDTYNAYKDIFMLQIKSIWKNKEPINQKVNVKCVYYRGDNRKCDLVNLQNGTLDLLVESGVLRDDNFKIVYSMDGSRIFYDKENPRVEITITTITSNEEVEK
jgi:Holliday junction resolvase RusA-like endonuclease